MREDTSSYLAYIEDSTAEISVPEDPFERIIGQDHAVGLVKSAIRQRRHVLLCGMPGIGKSMLAKAAASLLPEPKEEIVIHPTPTQPNRPRASIRRQICQDTDTGNNEIIDSMYVRPDDLPFQIGVEMGYRCPRCGGLCLPSQGLCMECDSPKRCDWGDSGAQYASFSGLFRALDVIKDPALMATIETKMVEGILYEVRYERTDRDAIRVLWKKPANSETSICRTSGADAFVLVARNTPRFIRVSGTSPVELLGDVKHDPYGSAETLGVAPHKRIVPGAIHEAHEGILYIDEISALGTYQKHLLTAMQDGAFPISGHNPNSSGAAVRVDNVPCNFTLFASCNLDDLQSILPPLRSRIRGYGYEILLSSWMKKTNQNAKGIVRFIAQTIQQDGRIPHLDSAAVGRVLISAEQRAQKLDGVRNAFTLRLRELGGLVRIAGDLAVQDGCEIVHEDHVNRAEILGRGISEIDALRASERDIHQSDYGNYFF
ncbi:MAG: ATP-binding protein [Candidatus Hodarchaeota archaeon]